jgi:hypothetical protein
MARLLTQTLTHACPAPASLCSLVNKVEVIDIDLSAEDATPSSNVS